MELTSAPHTQPGGSRMNATLARRLAALALALLATPALALPPTVNYDQPVSLNTGATGAPLATMLEALARTADATLLMHDVPDVTVQYAIESTRPVREVWDLLMNLHGLEYVMHDETTIIVAPPATLARFQQDAQQPERSDVFYRDEPEPEIAAGLISERFEATSIAFPEHDTLLVTATGSEHDRIAAFLQRLRENVTLASEKPEADVPAGTLANTAISDTVPTPSSTPVDPNAPTYVDYYDLGASFPGFVSLISDQHPSVRILPVDETSGLLAITTTNEMHDELRAYRSEYLAAVRRSANDRARPTSERTFALVNQQAVEAAEQLTLSLGPSAESVTITPNPRTNAIIVRGDAQAVQAAARVLESVDQRVPQLLLTMQITEITEREAERLGVNLAGSLGALAVNIVGGGLDFLLNPLEGVNGLTFDATLEALEEQNLARTVDETSIRVNHNHEASFKSGGQLQVQLADDEVTTIDFGSQMTVKPLISPDGTITLDIDSSISDFVGNLDGLNGLRLSERDLSTQVTFHVDETVILGGILRNSVTLTTSGPPILKDLPIIGGLFRSTEQGEERTDYVVVINAELID